MKTCLVLTSAVLLCGRVALAQGGPGKSFHVEVEGGLWNPSPQAIISSSTTTCTNSASRLTINVPCTDSAATHFTAGGKLADLVGTFGLHSAASGQFMAVVRVIGNQKVRFRMLPAAYDGRAATIPFPFGGPGDIETNGGGRQSPAKVTVRAVHVGYEWDVRATRVGYVGVTGELNYNRLSVNADSNTGLSLVYAHALTVPTVGVVGEGYLTKYLSAGGDVTLLRLDRQRTETFRDVDIFATANILRELGVRIGYRSTTLDYTTTKEPEESRILVDTGHVRTAGPFISVVVRF